MQNSGGFLNTNYAVDLGNSVHLAWLSRYLVHRRITSKAMTVPLAIVHRVMVVVQWTSIWGALAINSL